MIHQLPAFAPELPYLATRAFLLGGQAISPGDPVKATPHLMRQLYDARRVKPDYSGTRFVANKPLLFAGKRYRPGDVLPDLPPHTTRQFLNQHTIRARPKGRAKE